MLTEISFNNYKAFESGFLKIKPITILLGANSIGKTSLLHFILMLQQTAIAKENYKAALKLHGGFLSLGESKNIFRKHKTERPVSFKLGFSNAKLSDFLSRQLIYNKIEEIFEYANFTYRYSKDSTGTDMSVFKKYSKLFSDLRYSKNDTGINKILNGINDILDFSIENTKKIKRSSDKDVLNNLIFYSYRSNKIFRNIENRKNELISGIDFIKTISNLINDDTNFSLEYEIGLISNVLIIKNMKFYINNNMVFDIDMEINKIQKFKFNSPYLNDDKVIAKLSESLKKHFFQPRTIFSFVKNEDNYDNTNMEYSYIIGIIIEILTSSIRSLEKYFDEENINYVSPLRAHPKRYYFLDKAKINNYLDTLDGDALAETLKENENVKNQVNDWLRRFNLQVEVNKLEDILHKLTVNQNTLTLDITDVGFGISQVLPVIIQGFLSYENSITLIEQPEIHLHPKMQADLAELFIDIAIKKKEKNKREVKNLIIETHSEYLLKRLRRKISNGEIDANDVAIYMIRQNTEGVKDNSIIQELNIEKRGNFEYPIEFYGGELLKDDTEFLKNQLIDNE